MVKVTKQPNLPRTAMNALDLVRKARTWRIEKESSEPQPYWDGAGLKNWGDYEFRQYGASYGNLTITLREHNYPNQSSTYALQVSREGSKTRSFVFDRFSGNRFSEGGDLFSEVCELSSSVRNKAR